MGTMLPKEQLFTAPIQHTYSAEYHLLTNKQSRYTSIQGLFICIYTYIFMQMCNIIHLKAVVWVCFTMLPLKILNVLIFYTSNINYCCFNEQ